MIKIPDHIRNITDPPILKVKEWKKLIDPGKALIDLGQAVPNYPPPEGLTNNISRYAEDKGNYFYSPDQGIPDVRSAVAGFYKNRYNASVNTDDIILTAGANNAFTQSVMALFQPGDEIMIPEPYYFNHVMILQALNCIPRFVPAGEKEGYLPLIQDLDDKLTEQTKALVLVTPHNPTGATLSSDYILKLYDWARSRDIMIIIDETYQDFSSEPDASSIILRQPEWRKHILQVYTFSKSFSLCGMRIGTIIAGPGILSQILKIHDCNLICAPVIAQRAVHYAVRNELFWLGERIKEMRLKLSAFQKAFNSVSPHFSIVSSGAFFAYIRHDFPLSSWDLAFRLAKELNILCVPGEAFGKGQGKYLRFAFGNVSSDIFPELARRLNSF